MKKRDYILIGCILFDSSSVCGIFLADRKKGTGGSCHRRRRSVWYVFTGKGSGDRDSGLGIVCVIQNGQAKMEWADCPDQLCVHQKAISRTGESIICLPNQVVVSVQGSKESELDGIVN